MATFAETMLAKYETLLASAAGLDSITVDGQSVRYAGVEAKYRYWKREVAREKGQRPQAAGINFGRVLMAGAARKNFRRLGFGLAAADATVFRARRRLDGGAGRR